MAFITKEWKDRIVEYAGRRRLTNVSTQAQEIVDVERAEGTVSQAGDAFSAANMNDLEQRISDEFTAVNENLTALQSDFEKGDFGEKVNLSSYIGTRNNPPTTKYTIPSDGYLYLYGGDASGGVVNVSVFGSNSDEGLASFSAEQYRMNSLFVKKGMRCNAVNYESSAVKLFFAPLV